MARRELWAQNSSPVPSPLQPQFEPVPSERQDWTRDIIDRATRRAELRAEELEKRFRERMDARIAEENQRMDQSRMYGGGAEQADPLVSVQRGAEQQAQYQPHPMDQLRQLKSRVGNLDRSLGSPSSQYNRENGAAQYSMSDRQYSAAATTNGHHHGQQAPQNCRGSSSFSRNSR
ncbi:hypothetical protein T484DRAFT_1878593 [Baffinella frigidus]|nr:hypothetical protein T484DRAFT_1878593 [Cryptophyta sp. CCMP2293]